LADVTAASWEEIEEESGLTRTQLDAAAGMYANSKKTIIAWCTGLTQQRNGVDNVAMIVNLLLVGGNIGRPGAGTVCVRGHSNVQGDRTMGVWERPPKPFLDALGKGFNFTPPQKWGYDTVETLHAMFDGDVKVFFDEVVERDAAEGRAVGWTVRCVFRPAGRRVCRRRRIVVCPIESQHRPRLLILRERRLEILIGNIDLLLQRIELDVLEDFPPFAGERQVTGLRRLPLAYFFVGERRIDRGAMVLGTSCACGQREHHQEQYGFRRRDFPVPHTRDVCFDGFTWYSSTVFPAQLDPTSAPEFCNLEDERS
jgi:hypothetical protein